jgi:hypothetical protein
MEFRTAGGAWQRGPLMSCLETRFERVLQAREFRFEKGLRNFAGWWYFATTDSHVGFESWLERPSDAHGLRSRGDGGRVAAVLAALA